MPIFSHYHIFSLSAPSLWKACQNLRFLSALSYFCRFVSDTLEKERSHWELWAPCALGIGIWIYFSLTFEPSFGLGISVLSGGICLYLVTQERWQRYPWIRALLVICLGFVIGQGRTLFLETPLLTSPMKTQTLRGRIEQIENRPQDTRLILAFVDLRKASLKSKKSRSTLLETEQVKFHQQGVHTNESPKDGSPYQVQKSHDPALQRQSTHRVRLTFRQKRQERGENWGLSFSSAEEAAHAPQNFIPGDWIQVKGVLLPPSEPVAPGAYDFRRRAYFEGLSAVGYAVSLPEKTAIPPSQPVEDSLWLDEFAYKIRAHRYHITQILRRTLQGQEGEIAAAMVTGDRSGIEPEIRQAFADSGIAHILAISGLHLTVVSGFLFLVLRRILSLVPFLVHHYPIKKYAAGVAIFCTFGYLLLCGSPPYPPNGLLL